MAYKVHYALVFVEIAWPVNGVLPPILVVVARVVNHPFAAPFPPTRQRHFIERSITAVGILQETPKRKPTLNISP